MRNAAGTRLTTVLPCPQLSALELLYQKSEEQLTRAEQSKVIVVIVVIVVMAGA